MYRFTTRLGSRLYEQVKELPIIDFHNHISVPELAADQKFRDLTELWIAPDPYKHRAMRILGVDERLITGTASSYEKFAAWCGAYPQLVGNPLTVWSQMELARVTIGRMGRLTEEVFPVLTALMSATGRTGTAGLLRPLAALGGGMLTAVVERIAVVLCGGAAVLAVAGNLSERIRLKSLFNLCCSAGDLIYSAKGAK